MKWILMCLCWSVPLTVKASEILYNSETKQCETETGHSKSRNTGITQCARLTKVSRSKLSEALRYRKANGYSLNLRGIHIKDSDLSGVDFSEVDLEGAIFENVNLTDARFLRSHLSFAQFRSAQLKRVSFDLSELDGAVFDNSPVGFEWIRFARITHRTQIPSELRLELARDQRGQIAKVDIPKDVKNRFPGLQLFTWSHGFDAPGDPGQMPYIRPMIIPSLEARLQPLRTDLVESDEMGFNRSDLFDVLCAARFRSCLRSREGLSSMYGLSHIPQPLLNTGLEFYHGDTQDEGIGRFVSVAAIELEAMSLQEQIAMAKRQFSDWVQNNLGKTSAIDIGELLVLDPLDSIESFNVKFYFLPQPQEPTQCFLKKVSSQAKIKCKVIVDFQEADSPDPQWLQQKIQGFVRAAPNSTVQIDLRLIQPFHGLMLGDASVPGDESGSTLQFMTPVRNANFWTVNSDHYYSKSRWLGEEE